MVYDDLERQGQERQDRAREVSRLERNLNINRELARYLLSLGARIRDLERKLEEAR
jgi:hypothetical protein